MHKNVAEAMEKYAPPTPWKTKMQIWSENNEKNKLGYAL
jgi:hypothetical protein